MNILLLCENINGTSGWSTYSRDLLHSLRGRGHTVRAGVHDGTWNALLPRSNTLLTHPWLARLYAWRVKRMCDLLQPDVIHITVETYALLIPYLPQKWQAKTCLTIHGTFGVSPLKEKKLRHRARTYYGIIPRFITVSAYTKEKVTAALRNHCSPEEADAFARKSTVVHNGIILPPYAGKKASTDSGNILLVGGVKPRKGIIEALKACAAYRDLPGKPFHFTVVGSILRSDYEKEVRDALCSLGLEEHVTLTGMIDDAALEKAYGETDVFLMPSLTTEDFFEGFGLVFLEANARGIPVIGPDRSGTAEAINEGMSGYRVDVRDPDMIADRLRKILEEKTISAAACRQWAEGFSAEKCAAETEAVYKLIA